MPEDVSIYNSKTVWDRTLEPSRVCHNVMIAVLLVYTESSYLQKEAKLQKI